MTGRLRTGRVVAVSIVAFGLLTVIQGSNAAPPTAPAAASQAFDSPLFLPPPVHLVAADLRPEPVAPPATSAPAVRTPSREAKPVPSGRRAPARATPQSPRRDAAATTGEPIVWFGTIEIPKIGLVHDMYHGSTLANIDLGPTHMAGTALPGAPGNTAVGGHRVTHTHPFRNIHLLGPGDEIVFHVNGVRSVYAVTSSFVVTPDRIDILDPTPEPTATLFACHPPGSAQYRYVVRASLAG